MSQSGSFGTGGSGGSGIQTINGDVGSITGSNVTIFTNQANNLSGSTVLFTNSGTVSTLSMSDVSGNTFIGNNAGNSDAPGGLENTSLGGNSARFLETGSLGNTYIGFDSGSAATTGTTNTAIGFNSLGHLTSGSNNISIGYSAGDQLESNETYNIYLGHRGVTGESNTMRIGSTTGGGIFDVNRTFLAGVQNVTVTGSVMLVSDTDQIGDAGFGTAGQVLTSNGPGNSPAWEDPLTTFFSANLSAPTGNVTGDGTLYGPILFDEVLINTGGGYDPSTGLFTAQINGVHCFQQTVCFLGGDATTNSYITSWSGSGFGVRAFQMSPVITGTDTVVLSASISFPMNAGDTLGVQVLVSGTTQNIEIYGATPPTGISTCSLFSGFRVG